MADLESGALSRINHNEGEEGIHIISNKDDAMASSLHSVVEEQSAVQDNKTTPASDDQVDSRPTQPSLRQSFLRNVAAFSRAAPATKPPKETLKAVYAAGQYKAALTLDVLMVQSFMAGVYIAMAGQLYLSVGGGVMGSFLFPTGLVAVILTSAELFTSDALVFVASVLGRKVSLRSLLRNWTVAWICNFIGALAWAYFISFLSGSLEDVHHEETAIAVSLKKANQAWGAIFLKGMGANFMVCLGVWQATCAEEVSGKVLALWFPIAGFVTMGLDHCIANQYFIPLGMMYGADISVVRLLFLALLPATLGNIVGGGIFVGAVYWYVFDSMESNILYRERILQALKRPRRFGNTNHGSGANSGATTPSSLAPGGVRGDGPFRRTSRNLETEKGVNTL